MCWAGSLRSSTTVSSRVLSQKTWEEIGASGEMVRAAGACGAGLRPTKIQALAYKVIARQGVDVIVAEQTGSGKTLAYTLPIAERLRREDAQQQSASEKSVRPRVVVLAPTQELAAQVASTFRTAATVAPLRIRCLTGGADERDAARSLRRSGGLCDVLVATPGRLARLVDDEVVDLSRTTDVVLDEVDILALADGGEALKPLRDLEARFIFVTATLPKFVEDQLKAEFPNVATCKGPGLHRAPLGLTVELVECDPPDQKQENLRSPNRRRPSSRETDLFLEEDELLYEKRKVAKQRKTFTPPRSGDSESYRGPTFEQKKESLLNVLRLGRPSDRSSRLVVPRRTLVFCNTIESCRRVENALLRADRRSKDRRVLAYHSALSPETRKANLEKFVDVNLDLVERDDKQMAPPRRRSNLRQEKAVPVVLVCTDRASRGVDFGASAVDHVVLFDWPRDPNEFLRRVGRTARAGRQGYATILAAGTNLPVARKVLAACKAGLPILDDIDEFIKEENNKGPANKRTHPRKKGGTSS